MHGESQPLPLRTAVSALWVSYGEGMNLKNSAPGEARTHNLRMAHSRQVLTISTAR